MGLTTLHTPLPGAPAPRRAAGIEMIGEYEGSGFKEAPCLARRVDVDVDP